MTIKSIRIERYSIVPGKSSFLVIYKLKVWFGGNPQKRTRYMLKEFVFLSSNMVFKFQMCIGGFFFYLDFLSVTLAIQRAAGKVGGYFFNSSLPLPFASQTFRYQRDNYCRQLTSAYSQQPDSNWEPLFSEHKSLIAKLRDFSMKCVVKMFVVTLCHLVATKRSCVYLNKPAVYSCKLLLIQMTFRCAPGIKD